MASVAGYAAIIALSAVVLPDRVPVHFALGLQADRYGGRAELLLVAIGAGVLVVGVFVGSIWLIGRTSELLLALAGLGNARP